MSKLTPTLYILIEESGRELRAKLLIAAAAAERGMTVVLGDQQLLMSAIGSLPPGVVVFKGSGGPQVPLMATAKSFGHATASIDEECLGVVSDGIFERLQPPDIARWCDVFLVNGQHYKEFLSNVLGIDPRRIPVTGNPRIDLLVPSFVKNSDGDVARLRAAHGRFVLINTNFGSINSRYGSVIDDYYICQNVGLIDPTSERDNDDFTAWCQWERLNFEELIRLIRLLEDAIDLPIVIRPHPSERLETWQTFYSGNKRVHVERSGDHLAWIRASALMIHTSCTTGMEAFIMDCPAISLTPKGTNWHDHYLSNYLCPRFDNYRDAGAFAAAFLAGNAALGERAAYIAKLRRYLLVSESQALSADRIVVALCEAFSLVPTTGPPLALPRIKYLDIERRDRIQRAVMTATLNDVQAVLGAHRQALDRFHGLEAVEVAALTFVIRQRGARDA